MYIIDESKYFKKELIIPNSSEIDVSDNANPFNMWIEQQARLCLQYSLGAERFSEFDSFVDKTGTNAGNLNDSAPDIWKELVNGKTYTYEDKTYNWRGLIFTEGNLHRSLLAYFTYAAWLDEQLTSMTGIGEVKGRSVNSDPVYSRRNYKKRYNDFVTLYQGNVCEENGNYYLNSKSSYVSLIEYLIHNEADYPDTEKKLYPYENMLGI